MKKILCSVLCITICLIHLNAQDSVNKRHEKFKAIKVGFITEQLNLSVAEAKQFWPQYDLYSTELKNEIQKNVNNEMTLEENVLAIRKKYFPIFKNIFNDEARVNKLYKLEREFVQRVHDRMGKHRGGRRH